MTAADDAAVTATPCPYEIDCLLDEILTEDCYCFNLVKRTPHE